ncbi:hypothetical protein [Janthinobacterium sp. AD80]|uniref:hypothetical protein n=1 Tax=Janthinobacterium sp. AD80 TaxID=1528773 RepID=UPI000CCAA4E0|nr:hypothetical protein [Janthinobacterium sp. AD80]PMQ18436.1 hypothetical protein JaAD80_00570 [Janthinobacterium sp. AD80]
MTVHIALPGQPAEIGACIFCGSVEKMTGEHLFAHWISKAIDEGNRSGFKTTLKFNGKIEIKEFNTTKFTNERDIGHANTKLNVLCENCNSVWGGKIQEQASMVLKPFLASDTWGMSDSQREKIAIWIASFIIVRQYLHPELLCFDEQERHEFRRTTIPPRGLSVWVARYDGKNSYESKLRTFRFASSFSTDQEKPNICITTMVFGSLIFFTYYCADRFSGRQYTISDINAIHLHNQLAESSESRKITPNPTFEWPHNSQDSYYFNELSSWPLHNLLDELGMNQVWPTFEFFSNSASPPLNYQDYLELNDLASQAFETNTGSLENARAIIRKNQM